MKKGGYQIIDLSAYKFTNGEPQIIKNVFNIIKNTKKVVLISGLTVDDTEYHDMFTVFTDYETFFCGLAQYEGNNICFVVNNDGSVTVNVFQGYQQPIWDTYPFNTDIFGTTALGLRTWTDGVNVYYSYNSDSQYLTVHDNFIFDGEKWVKHELNKQIADGSYVWYDLNGGVYYRHLYEFVNGEWVDKTWVFPDGLSSISAENVWNDGTNTYYSDNTANYKLVGDEWQSVGFKLKRPNGSIIDYHPGFYGYNVTHINGKTYIYDLYMYELVDGVFTRVYFKRTTAEDFRVTNKRFIWKDYNNNYYYSDTTNQYRFDKEELIPIDWGENRPDYSSNMFTYNGVLYLLDSSGKSMKLK